MPCVPSFLSWHGVQENPRHLYAFYTTMVGRHINFDYNYQNMKRKGEKITLVRVLGRKIETCAVRVHPPRALTVR